MEKPLSRSSENASTARIVQMNMFPPSTPLSASEEQRRLRVLLIGEAPGTWPDLGTTPNNWPLSKTVKEWLTLAGLEDTQVMLTNVWRDKKKGEREDLNEAIRQSDPGILVTLGREAINALACESRTMGEWIGDFFLFESQGRFRVAIPFPHPSGRNRMLNGEVGRDLVTRAVETLKLARKTLSHEEQGRGD